MNRCIPYFSSARLRQASAAIVLFTACQVVVAAPPDNDAPKDAGDIAGTVTGCGGQPLADVLVYAPGTSFDARTDAAGNFRVSYVQAGIYDLIVKQSGITIGTVPQVTVVKRQTTSLGSVTFCNDLDGDGFEPPADCDDNNPSINPDAAEECGDGDDNNCNGIVDEGCTVCIDFDNDGFFGQAGCNTLVDCDDGDATRNPSATEVCNSVDDDCDAQVDEPGAIGEQTWYPDFDGDGYGSTADGVASCTPPPGFISQGGDCDDANPAINPGATEVCDNVDNDCNGSVDDGLVEPAINGAFVCSAGSTSLVCDPGFSDCDGDFLNGCEIATATDPENCGFCGAICPGIGDQDLGICVAGICQSQ